MIAEIQSLPSAAVNGEHLWLKEINEIDLARFDLNNSQYIGRLYLISASEAKTFSEGIGFTARFENPGIRTARFQAWQNDASIVFAMAKNTKPIDVGLRYMADRWQAPNRRQLTGPSLAMDYQAKSLPPSVWDALCDQLAIQRESLDSVYVRVNFKDLTFVLITEKENEAALPVGAAYCFCLTPGNRSGGPPNNKEYSEVGTTTMSMNQRNSEVLNSTPKAEAMSVSILNEPAAKYATYSRSEVDLLLKKQAENIANNLNTKIINQQKAGQEATRAQEQKIAKIIDELHIYCETARKRIDDAEAKRAGGWNSTAEQSKKQLTSEIEQFKTYLNKQVMPNLRSLEDRVLTLVNATTLSKESKPERDHATTMLALLALLLSIVNLGLLVLRH